MADLPQYTGVTYDAEMYKKPEETMSDYMLRLAKLRASGVLGGGGMLDTAKPAQVVDTNAAAPLGQVVVNRPSSGGNYEAPTNETTAPTVRNSSTNYGLTPDLTKGVASLLPFPFSLLAGAGIAYNDSEAIKAAQIAANIPEDQRTRSWFKGAEDVIGSRDINDKTYQVSIGGIANDPTNNIVESLFNMGNQITTLTPDEARRRASSAQYRSQPMTFGVPAAPTLPTLVDEAEALRTLGMMDTLAQLNTGSISGGDSGYYSDSSGSYTGGSDYGGWTGVTADGSGNDWNSF